MLVSAENLVSDEHAANFDWQLKQVHCANLKGQTIYRCSLDKATEFDSQTIGLRFSGHPY